jgi:hypothetical protein
VISQSTKHQALNFSERLLVPDIKAVFESMVNDPQGLRTWELAKFIKKVEKQLFILTPRYNEENDLELLLELSGITGRPYSPNPHLILKILTSSSPTPNPHLIPIILTQSSPHRVTDLDKDMLYIDFMQFERWWKYRVGLLEADTPVIPEFFEYKMVEMSEAARIKQAQEKRKFLSRLPRSFSMKLGRGKSKRFETTDLEANFTMSRTGKELWVRFTSNIQWLLPEISDRLLVLVGAVAISDEDAADDAPRLGRP